MVKQGWLNKLDEYADIDDGYWFVMDYEERSFKLYSYKKNKMVDYAMSPKRCKVQQRKTLNKGRASFVIRQKGGRRTTTKCVYAMMKAVDTSAVADLDKPQPRIMPGTPEYKACHPIFESYTLE